MIPQAYITAWRSDAPWADDAQVEQDLVLTRALAELFSNPELAGQLALRGGTALNKLHISPPRRYSEDIDLVQVHAGSIGSVLDGIRNTLDAWLGTPRRTSSQSGVTLVYRFESEIPPVRPLRLKIEMNTREHFTVLGHQHLPLVISNPWFSAESAIRTFDINELMGTKLRALYQRRKGRDLFDLWLCLEGKLTKPEQVVSCFLEYMSRSGKPVSRAEFEQNLHNKKSDPEFLADINPLLANDVKYRSSVAFTVVYDQFVSRIPGNPWKGTSDVDDRHNDDRDNID
ncbi:MAG: nucleotidyl transferase AbiEii/AbiGii toxin family protein [Phycisphaerae bacterium]